ncbi:uncharacterized protein EAE98_011449 [Botrytis deweyae]|uniref:Hemolysin-III channel protein Izh2 n=1 Tax=Botrytis deweyae TaxID=2478750 RepID=A0ABQ7I5V6_9HELO|nr:uncharacterized protein EAE98_011449 [Botrytis deweyae]KAF7914750.1 hypothetical protein EAE98_011449 [Botrytis deweyae]
MMEKSKLPDSDLPNFQQSECEKPPSPLIQSQDSLTHSQDSTSPSPKCLITYDDLPSWHQDNPSIYTSYRPITHSLRESLKTFFTLHNETLNIHTHSLPFLISLLLTGLIFYIFSIHFPTSPLVDRFIFSLFFLTTMICMGFSMGYHTLMNHSKGIAEIWLKLDFVGIVLAILGDFVTGIYVAFYCEWRFQVGYWVMIITLTSATLILLLHPHFQGLRWRTFRVCIFIGTGCSAFAPIIHAIVYFGWHQVVNGTGMPWYLGEGGFLVLGAMVYSLRIPECYFPGKFDILGHSHQIFHLLVVAASVMHLVGLLKAYEYEYYYPRCSMR